MNEPTELTHELLEGMLKTLMDKLKFHLCLKFPNDSYSIALSDGLASDAVILNGDTVTIKFKTSVFVTAITKRNTYAVEFKQLMEHCLRQVVRMQITLTHTPPADTLMFDKERRVFKKVTKAEYDKLHPKFGYEKEIHYRSDVRTTAIHWKSGVIVREFGASTESSHRNARRRILKLLNDPEIYNRQGDTFYVVEDHDDLIHDYVIEAKPFSKDEIEFIIKRLREEYLK